MAYRKTPFRSKRTKGSRPKKKPPGWSTANKYMKALQRKRKNIVRTFVRP